MGFHQLWELCRLVGIGGLWPECSLDGIWWLNSSSREIRNAKTWVAWLKVGKLMEELEDTVVTVDGKDPANQLRLVVYPIICMVLYIVFSIFFFHQQYHNDHHCTWLIFLVGMKLELQIYGNLRNFRQIVHCFWSNYSDLTRPHPKLWFSKGNPLISGESRLVKYYILARLFGLEF